MEHGATPSTLESRAVVLSRLRQLILDRSEEARGAGKELADRIASWIATHQEERRQSIELDAILLECARDLVVDPDTTRANSDLTIEQATRQAGEGAVLPQGLPQQLPRWMASLFEKLRRLDFHLIVRVEECFVPWLERARDFGVDLESVPPAEAFIKAQIEEAKKLGMEIDEEQARSEFEAENAPLSAPHPWALAQIIASMIEQGVGQPNRPSWWEAAVGTLIALDPTFDARGVGMVGFPHWGSPDQEDMFATRELVDSFIPDHVRFADGEDRLWTMATSAIVALRPEQAKQILDSTKKAQRPPSLQLDDPQILEAIIRTRLFQEADIARALAVYQKVTTWPVERIPRKSLGTQFGLPPTSVDAFWKAAPDRGGREEAGARVTFTKEFLIQFIVLSWSPRMQSRKG